MNTALVAVRFKSARSSLTSIHFTGTVYHVPPGFAKLVVEQEQVAEYVDEEPATPQEPAAEGAKAQKKKR